MYQMLKFRSSRAAVNLFYILVRVSTVCAMCVRHAIALIIHVQNLLGRKLLWMPYLPFTKFIKL